MFTVVIATCDRPERLTKALDAVGRCVDRYDDQARVVVADNGRLHPAGDVVQDFAQRAPCAVRCVEAEPRNKSAALNAGIAAAQTEWLAFTDDDCLPDLQWLCRGKEFVTRTGVRVAGGRLVPGPVETPLPRWLRPGRSGRVPRGPAFMVYRPMSASGELDAHAMVPFGANLFVHKTLFEERGAYDEALWKRCGRAALGSEDAEFGMRVREAGERIGYCAEAVVVHPVFAERMTLRSYWRYAYRMGRRQPLLDGDAATVCASYLLRAMLKASLRGSAALASGDAAAAACELTAFARAAGHLRGRYAASAVPSWRGRGQPGSAGCPHAGKGPGG